MFRDRKVEIPNNDVPPHKTVAELVEGEQKAAGDAPILRKQHHFRDLGIKIAGFGGQGVLLLGQLLAEMGMQEGLEVSWLPSYGPEMRSGRPETRSGDAEHRSGYPRDPFRRPETRLSHSETLPSDAEIQSGDSETRSRSGEMSPNGAERRWHYREMTFDRSGDRSERRRDASTRPRWRWRSFGCAQLNLQICLNSAIVDHRPSIAVANVQRLLILLRGRILDQLQRAQGE